MSNAASGSAGKAENKVKLVRLAERAFPRRVRFLLDGLQERTAYFEGALGQLFDEVEQRLFKQADCARSNEQQARFFEAIREIKRGKSDMLPRFLVHLESSLATIDKEPSDTEQAPGRANRNQTKLELVDSRDLEISLAIQDIGNKTEIRHTSALHLLGHRLGVIAGRAAFESSDMPLGPMALARALEYALCELDLEQEDRINVFHDFDSVVMGTIGQFYENLNRYLAEQGVLPNLQFQGHKGPAQKTGGGKAPAADAEQAPGGEEGTAAESPSGGQPQPGQRYASSPPAQGRPAPGQPGPSPRRPAAAQSFPADPSSSLSEQPDSNLFASLRGLLAERRRSLDVQQPASPSGYMATREDLQSVLGALQSISAEPIQQNGKTVPRSIGHVKQDLLNELRAKSPDGQTPVLAEEDSDTIDLVGMLFDYIGQNLASHSGSRELISKLQVPVLRSAISDKNFFTQRDHPARQLLNNVAEASVMWMGDEETDTGLVDTMTSMVDRVSKEFTGDMTLVESLLDDLGRYMSQITRRAEITERRHIDAAKGRERLDLSREQANSAIARLLKRGKPAPMVRAVLEQAWTDVLALTLLRQGEDSQAYRRCLAVADQLMQIGSGSDVAKVEDKVREEVRSGLLQVGLHSDEVEGVVAKLFDPASVEKKSSHTELAHALKNKARLGGEVATGKAGEKAAEGDGPPKPLTAEEKDMVQRIRTLPFGTWFEFVTNQQGSVVRRKLAWFSTVTGRCLFVNQRGARAEEKTIEQLARDLVRGQVRIHKNESGSLIDRAWKAIMGKLQQFTGQPGLPASA
ncbi:DUF1631 domain-containing protein [Dokdonella sp.]|uniref:DUF1631 domain-containing protein n=1 Tax=Dokdonella sp. TaxID=2291710 RepID=UPI0035280760